MAQVLHVAYTYFPETVGGTEVYVRALARGLRRDGIESTICAPGPHDRDYAHEGFRVRRFAGAGDAFTLEHGYGDGDPVAGAAFERILDEERPRLVHLHALTAEVSVRTARAVKARGIPLVFTYHTANATCASETLVRDDAACDGRLDAARCASCNLKRLGMPRALAALTGQLPSPVGALVAKTGIAGAPITAIRMRELMARKHRAIAEFLRLADEIVAPSRWVRALLLGNEVPASKITLCAQGLERTRAKTRAARVPGGPLRIAALARLDPAKGVHVLLDAIAARPALRVELDVYGVPWSAGDGYARALANAASRDGRIRLLPPLAPEDVLETIAAYDLLAVPSQILETGPLVALEAFAAGVPVIGSDLGGIAERVTHGVDGLLVPASDRDAWARAFERVAGDRLLLERLRRGIASVPAMQDVASAMHAIYARLWAFPAIGKAAPAHGPAEALRPAAIAGWPVPA